MQPLNRFFFPTYYSKVLCLFIINKENNLRNEMFNLLSEEMVSR